MKAIDCGLWHSYVLCDFDQKSSDESGRDATDIYELGLGAHAFPTILLDLC